MVYNIDTESVNISNICGSCDSSKMFVMLG
jgi:hypothetical protein